MAATTKASSTTAKDRTRLTLRFDEDTHQRLQYWANRSEKTITEYVLDAVNFQIAFENRDYPLVTLEQARLNQLVDENRALSTNVANLERTVRTSIMKLLDLTRGDNLYLSDTTDGELDR